MKVKKGLITLISAFFVIGLTSCKKDLQPHLKIIEDSPLILDVNETYQLKYETKNLQKPHYFSSSNENIVSVSNEGLLKTLKKGSANIKLNSGQLYDQIQVIVNAPDINLQSWGVRSSKESLDLGEQATLTSYIDDEEYKYLEEDIVLVMRSNRYFATLEGNIVTANKEGKVEIVATLPAYDLVSTPLIIPIYDSSDPDPYINVDIEEFYENYTEASDAIDAMYRSYHYLMSGDITPVDQEPIIFPNRKEIDGMYVHNSNALYSSDKKTYYVYNGDGEIEKEIYKDGAYVSLEDVAAYVYAFGDVPVNYTDRKNAKPSNSPWLEYLRLNNTFFSGDINSYPYEPILPRIYGVDGDLVYYEIDIGTTGTDTNPAYPARVYNDGKSITRGAARIVYSRYYADTGEEITDLNDRYVFYTYNHYNDFQEYLNYYNGWGEMFGNATAGNGPDVYDPDNPPSPYVETIRVAL
ncbi:MAG: hypothetical protein ACOX28_00310 [Bacilli bacterium]